MYPAKILPYLERRATHMTRLTQLEDVTYIVITTSREPLTFRYQIISPVWEQINASKFKLSYFTSARITFVLSQNLSAQVALTSFTLQTLVNYTASIPSSCTKSVRIRLVATCHLQTCYNLLKQLAASLRITSFHNELEISL